MAVTTYNELYSLLKDNIVDIVYNKASSPVGADIGQMNIKMTLKRELIPENSNSLKNYDVAISTGDWSLSGDSDGALPGFAGVSISLATMTYPDYIKAFSINYGEWINIKISDIVSTTVVSEE